MGCPFAIASAYAGTGRATGSWSTPAPATQKISFCYPLFIGQTNQLPAISLRLAVS